MRAAIERSWLLGVCAIALGCSTSTTGAECVRYVDCAAGESCVDGRCEPGPGGGRDAGGALDGGGEPDASPPPVRDGSVPPTEDGGCGSEVVDFDYRPPNVLLVFDRSCSMRRRLGEAVCSDPATCFGTGPDDPTTRWYTAREAVVGLATRYPTRVFWGLMAFPDPREGCGLPVETEVPPGPGNASLIATELERRTIQPWGLCGDPAMQPFETPTSDALRSVGELSALRERESFALLVTDGGAACADLPESTTLLSGLASDLRDAGIPVAVVGFTVTGREDTLEAIAASGGMPNTAGPTSYYVAEDRAGLDRVFDEIAERVVRCDLALSSVPPDPTRLFVNANGAPLASDPVDGWTYEAESNALRLHGASCDALRSGETTRIDIAFGCAPVACTPKAEVCNGLDEDCDGTVDEECLL